MGSLFSRFAQLLNFCPSPQHKILILGLDGAGKTTLLYWTRLQTAIVTIPTIGLNVEEVKLPKTKITFLAWDIGGQDKLRVLWSRFYEGTKGLIFIVDSSDVQRLDLACEQLWSVLSDPIMKDIPVLVLANKQDLPTAVNVSDLEKRLKLICLNEDGHKWMIRATVATTGQGVMDALESFGGLVKQSLKQRKYR
ncbi:ADP-ribosylation like factor [Paragonimus heterotremus]|uniref:ADP-ribosylation like factor n=1 Tax=Paragonimus heterotremus TaxID=100268 RepID=A0A8J4WJ95_9TREM|nr:ADP-ribosylation like factor [Paragonimus heterotremus]